MHAIKANEKRINDVKIDTFERKVVGPKVILEAEAGTNGYKGLCRDAGGRTYLRLECRYGDFFFRPVIMKRKGDRCVNGIEIGICGDVGMEALIKALQFSLDALNDQRCEIED